MIELIGDYKKYKYTNDAFLQIVNEARMKMIYSFNHFLDLLELDYELFNHLFDIKIYIDFGNEYDYDEMLACYESNDNTGENHIVILSDFINDMLLAIDKGYDRKEVIDEIAKCIMHETLHANRDIILNHSVHRYNLLFSNKNNNSSKTIDELNYILSKQDLNSIGNFIILKIRLEKEYNYVYVYNNDNSCYEVYKFNRKIKYNTFNYYRNMLNLDYLRINRIYKPIQRYPTLKQIDKLSGVSNFSWVTINNINYLSEEERTKQLIMILKQVGFEESMTEVLSNLIIYCSDKESFEQDNYCNDLLLDDNLHIDEKAVLELIKRVDIEILKWYLISCMEDSYEDKFYKIFRDDFYKLIDYYHTLYHLTISKSEDKDNIYDKLANLLDKKITLRKK